MSWEVGKVYRVTVRHPYPRQETVVKYGTKRMLSQTWAYHLDAYKSARYSRDTYREAGRDDWADRYEAAIANAVFKVEVAPLAVFQDISASYDVDTALAARESLRTINHAA